MSVLHVSTVHDCVVIGSEVEACLAAVAAARSGLNTCLVAEAPVRIGGILTWGGLAYIDRDSRHLFPPTVGGPDGLFGEFLVRAGVALVALDPDKGRRALLAMLREAGVQVRFARPVAVEVQQRRLQCIVLSDGERLACRHAIDGTPDGDLLELLGASFETGFTAHDVDRVLGTSPMPIVRGVSPQAIVETCRKLALDPSLEALRREQFGDRPFLGLEQGEDWILVGPPHLGLAYRRYRSGCDFADFEPLEADGFNIAVLGPDTTSWNGLLLDIREPRRLLALSREGSDASIRAEGLCFEAFLREALGWQDARVEMPSGLYVRQTRHLIEAVRRLSFSDILAGDREDAIGSFSYYPDFRGLHLVPIHRPLVAPVPLGSGIFAPVPNVGIASRAGGYTPFAHSLARLVQFGCILGSGLGVAVSLSDGDLGAVAPSRVREGLAKIGGLADDIEGATNNLDALATCQGDPFLALETA